MKHLSYWKLRKYIGKYLIGYIIKINNEKYERETKGHECYQDSVYFIFPDFLVQEFQHLIFIISKNNSSIDYCTHDNNQAFLNVFDSLKVLRNPRVSNPKLQMINSLIN